MIIQVYAPTNNAEEAEAEWFYEDIQYFLELTPQKDVLFIIGGWNAKVGSQEIPGKFGLGVQNEAGQRLIREHTGHSKYPLPSTQEKTLESPLDCKEIQPVHSKGDQPWDFFGSTDAKAETPILWPPHAKS